MDSESIQQETLWEFGDIGFDTARLLWFIQLSDKTNQIVSSRHARNIVASGGLASQYQWKDYEGRPFWHIRERFFSHDVKSISDTPDGAIHIEFCDAIANDEEIPNEFSYVLYAYHLKNKDASDSSAPFGFVDFFDSDDRLLCRIDKRWIILEGVARATYGEYPSIRIRVEHDDISNLLVTSSCIVLQGSGQNTTSYCHRRVPK
jgi:hypothetical protein